MKHHSPHDLKWQEWIAIHMREITIAGVVLVALFIALRSVEWPGSSVVSGRVTSQGKPVTFGTVTVLDANDRPHVATINADGTYVLRSVPPGPVRVAVSSPNPRSIVERAASGDLATNEPPKTVAAAQSQADKAAGGTRHAAGGGNAPRGPGKAGGADDTQGVSIAAAGAAAVPPPPSTAPAAHRPDWFPIPGRYANPAASGIRTSVRPGRTSLDLKLD